MLEANPSETLQKFNLGKVVHGENTPRWAVGGIDLPRPCKTMCYLAGVAVREVLVDGDRGHAGSLKALDRLSAAADDAPDKSRGAVDRLAGFGSDR